MYQFNLTRKFLGGLGIATFSLGPVLFQQTWNIAGGGARWTRMIDRAHPGILTIPNSCGVVSIGASNLGMKKKYQHLVPVFVGLG